MLLLNYFSVLFLTIAFGIYIKKPEQSLKSFSLWYWLSHVLLALVLYKVIQLYDGFKIIYIVDVLFVALFALSNITLKSSKTNKIEQLAKALPRLHKLSTDEFSAYLTTLFKAYGFQSVKQVKIQNDDPSNTHDYYLLARHEGSLVEIRIVNQTKTLTENHINQVASSFRDSPSQATSWLLATSAKIDESTNIFIRNSGADIKVFDLKAISDLVYVLAPNYKPNSGIIKNTSLGLIDFLLNVLSNAKRKLTLDQPHPEQSSDFKATQQFLSDVLNEADADKPSNMELFEELEPESLTEPVTSNEEPKQKRSKKKKESSKKELQGDLKLGESQTESEEPKRDTPPTLISATEIGSSETVTNNTDLKELQDKKLADDGSLDTETVEINPNSNEVMDETVTVEQDTDPLMDLNDIGDDKIPVISDDTDLSEFQNANDELIKNSQSDILELDNLSTESAPLKETIDDETKVPIDIEMQTEQHIDENVTIEVEADPLDNLDGVIEAHTVAVETHLLDDFPEVSDTNILTTGNDDTLDLFAVDGDALNHQESDLATATTDLLLGVESSPSELLADSTDLVISSQNIDLLGDESPAIKEGVQQVKIDMSDLGAALPQEAPKTRKNRNTTS